MKIRAGFVSNSSSSSFIVAAKDRPTVTIEIDLSKFASYTIKTPAELDAAFVDHYGSRKETVNSLFKEYGPSLKESYDKCRDALSSGLTVYLGRVSSDNDDESAFLYNYGIPKSPSIEIIVGRDY